MLWDSDQRLCVSHTSKRCRDDSNKVPQGKRTAPCQPALRTLVPLSASHSQPHQHPAKYPIHATHSQQQHQYGLRTFQTTRRITRHNSGSTEDTRQHSRSVDDTSAAHTTNSDFPSILLTTIHIIIPDITIIPDTTITPDTTMVERTIPVAITAVDIILAVITEILVADTR
ncbi:hypothetical protein LTR56_013242 [Elasticomyces elasticus]|nr:hypothetical protein LTR56_013242 [Elasticomyces elasticus]KAK3650099.1 hypothetical protein LTR22_012694 [Elasticomyces elasticus]KAK4920064.1 hypothetical protein LTR49_012325 [Elasticomyces elasticus]KAK5757211.1 hypothetical protein LTS12_012727 [Elasticomyces elasticus]